MVVRGRGGRGAGSAWMLTEGISSRGGVARRRQPGRWISGLSQKGGLGPSLSAKSLKSNNTDTRGAGMHGAKHLARRRTREEALECPAWSLALTLQRLYASILPQPPRLGLDPTHPTPPTLHPYPHRLTPKL